MGTRCSRVLELVEGQASDTNITKTRNMTSNMTPSEVAMSPELNKTHLGPKSKPSAVGDDQRPVCASRS